MFAYFFVALRIATSSLLTCPCVLPTIDAIEIGRTPRASRSAIWSFKARRLLSGETKRSSRAITTSMLLLRLRSSSSSERGGIVCRVINDTLTLYPKHNLSTMLYWFLVKGEWPIPQDSENWPRLSPTVIRDSRSGRVGTSSYRRSGTVGTSPYHPLA
jgi:hypothetical protein